MNTMTAFLAGEPVNIQEKRITGEELAEMGGLGPCELINGVLVEMSPASVNHGYFELNLAAELRSFVRQQKLGWVVAGEVGVYTRRNPDTVRGVDAAFVSKEKLPKRPKRGYLTVAPELIVEVVSPGDLWDEINEKIEEYFAIGVMWIWVLEPKHQVVRVYDSPTTFNKLTKKDVLEGEGILQGFRLPVAEIFDEEE